MGGSPSGLTSGRAGCGGGGAAPRTIGPALTPSPRIAPAMRARNASLTHAREAPHTDAR